MSKVKNVLSIVFIAMFLVSCATKQCGKTGCYAWEQEENESAHLIELNPLGQPVSLMKKESKSCAAK